MSTKEQLLSHIKDAMRSKDKERLNTLRSISAAIKQFEVDNREEATDAVVLGIIQKLAKQRKESITQFEKAGRDDLIQIEQFELKIIESYLPEPLSDAELTALISEAIASTEAQTVKDMGKVMAYIKSKADGRVDMGKVGAQIKSSLA